ncbi:TolB family protein [Streptomyces telluris]|uniref:PD40 domain-containing protein n=1 Tax=Streptomyces telluris TaxID=2720021 RepID=A0A9X2LPJ6_9ACTN|nr:PD40 domain-containing protein [Streptomyces telluris]MCQ8774910.1 PD40 domain-containing protein [Streptomyces telluris]NJP81396.1 hypothetical protein [Streptomyces telluris]
MASDGTPADDSSFDIALSADGRYAAFESRADNLSPDKRPGDTDLFVRDRRTGRTELLLENKQQQAGTSYEPAMSADGRFVAFASSRTDLVPGPSTDPMAVYVRDRWKGTTQRVSVRSDGSQAGTRSAAPVISADGSKVGFLSLGGLGEGEGGSGADGAGQGLARPRLDSFYARDLRTGVTRRLSVAHDGAEALGDSRGPVMSGDNRKVFFSSTAPNLIPGGSGGTDGRQAVYARDLHTGAVERLDVADNGTPADGDSDGVAVDLTGRTAVFTSAADNLVPDDTDKAVDVFLRRLA